MEDTVCLQYSLFSIGNIKQFALWTTGPRPRFSLCWSWQGIQGLVLTEVISICRARHCTTSFHDVSATKVSPASPQVPYTETTHTASRPTQNTQPVFASCSFRSCPWAVLVMAPWVSRLGLSTWQNRMANRLFLVSTKSSSPSSPTMWVLVSSTPYASIIPCLVMSK